MSDNNQEQAQEAQEPKEADRPKLVPVTELVSERNRRQALEAKLREFETADETRRQAELSEVDRFKAENAKLAAKLQHFEINGRKQEALRKAKTKVGDGWTLEGAEDRIERAVAKLTFDEKTYQDDIAELVEMAKKPKQVGRSPLLGTPPRNGAEREDPTKLTGKELGQMAKEDPEEFQRVMAERRVTLVAWPASPAQPKRQ